MHTSKSFPSSSLEWNNSQKDDCLLFGGAISTTFPLRFEDVSNIREVPHHQEVFVDPACDESLIFELLELKHDVADNGSATWFLQDLARDSRTRHRGQYRV
ncbi:hypothetical protein L2E82_01515 [Cichorium intybus]|uniref:Uncharacterized protein n=1 Tax=Cichorium intybus TaxID=13427 RepID=A0ACB9H197_CICIN|nr:hypothetical protein L2E82_01515 [Cichorium intybus]